MLVKKGKQCLGRRGICRVARKLWPVAEVPAATDHRQVNAEHALLRDRSDDIDVTTPTCLDVLLVLHLAQGLYLITVGGRLLKGKPGSRFVHRYREAIDDILLPPLEKHYGHLHILRVARLRDCSNARCGAALDLVEKTRPGAVVENPIFTGAQTKHPL